MGSIFNVMNSFQCLCKHAALEGFGDSFPEKCFKISTQIFSFSLTCITAIIHVKQSESQYASSHGHFPQLKSMCVGFQNRANKKTEIS